MTTTDTWERHERDADVNAIFNDITDLAEDSYNPKTSTNRIQQNMDSLKQNIDKYIKNPFIFDDKKTEQSFTINHNNDEDVLTKTFKEIEKVNFKAGIYTIRVPYRSKSKEATLNRINLSFNILEILNLLKGAARVWDNKSDNCGFLGNKCFLLDEIFKIFNQLTNALVDRGAIPIGQLNMSNEIAFQMFQFKSDTAPKLIANTSGGGKTKKQKNKKTKKQKNKKTQINTK